MTVYVRLASGDVTQWPDVGGFGNEPGGALIVWADGGGISAKAIYPDGEWREAWFE